MAGEELCDAFVNIFQAGVARREQLRDLYSFDCQCARCCALFHHARADSKTGISIDSVNFAAIERDVEHVCCPLDASHQLVRVVDREGSSCNSHNSTSTSTSTRTSMGWRCSACPGKRADGVRVC